VQKGTSTSATVIVDTNHAPVTSPVSLGTTVRDTATVAGTPNTFTPTGTVTFQFFTTIDGTGPHTNQTVTLNPDGSVPDSALHGPLAAGSYSFVAVYSGDSNYLSARSGVEPLTVQQGTSTSATAIVDANEVPVSSPVSLGTTVADTATVAGTPSVFTPTGTVTYQFFTTIDGTGPHADELVTLNSAGTVPASALHGPLAAGSYSFIAVYSGDRNYAGSTSAVEPLRVKQGASTTVTVIVDSNGVPVTSPVPPGTSVVDTAAITGQHPGLPATGTVTYQFFTTIDGTGPHTDETVSLNPDGSVPDSTQHGPLAAGSYSFTAIYSGDSNYLGSTSAVERLTVTQASADIPTVISLQRFGFHKQPTEFVLTFRSALDKARAQDIRNYTLVPIGPKGHRGRQIHLLSAVYDPQTLTVAIHPLKRVYLFRRYELVVNGTAPDGLASPSGALLDGRGNGEAGTNFVKVFGPRILGGRYRNLGAITTPNAQHTRVDTAHSTTRDPMPTLHRPLRAVPSDTTTPGTARGRLHADAVDKVLETIAPSRIGKHGKR
jgi:hypothetical protein